MDAESMLAEVSAKVDKRLDRLIPPETQTPTELHAAMRYSSLGPGKKIRPALCLASATAVGNASDAVLDAACAIEMVHCFSLIHDDLPAIDDDDLRRGRPTCHKVYGEAIAILAGDALFAQALQILAEVDAPDRLPLLAVQKLAAATGSLGLVGGEVMDVLCEGRDVEEETLHFIHSRKTAALIAASCEIGGMLGRGDPASWKALADFGWHVGLAFQITDDLLNELSTSEALGKAAGSDRLRKKATYPALHGIEGSRRAAASAVAEGLARVEDMGTDADPLRCLARYAVERLH